MNLYLASPFGFSEAGRAFYNGTLIPKVKALDHGILDPWTLTDPAKIQAVLKLPWGEERRNRWIALDAEIGKNNTDAINRCDAVLAVLDGADIDSGTAAEIGYAAARAKPILGYRGDFRICSDNEGAIVNLQVEYFIRSSGGSIITSIDALPQGLKSLESALKHPLPE